MGMVKLYACAIVGTIIFFAWLFKGGKIVPYNEDGNSPSNDKDGLS